MQTKFIAGPWAVFHDHPDAETAKSCATIRPAGSERHESEVCNVYLCDYPGETGERMTATARLIAAAPDLLDALRVLVRDVAIVRGEMADGTELEPALLQAARAIAKAIGEQQ